MSEPAIPTDSNFEFHYDEASTLRGVLSHILRDLAGRGFKAPSWANNRQFIKNVASAAYRYLDKVGSGEASELAAGTAIDDVSVSDGSHARRAVVVDSTLPTKRHFFLSEVGVPDWPIAWTYF